MARVRLAAALFVALAVSAPARAEPVALTLPSPVGLHGFVLRANEPVVHTFSRTPSFAWSPVAGARSYQFELATSRTFSDGGIVWSANSLTGPAVSVPLSLPWMTGLSYSLYAHVRAVTRRGITAWSRPFGFNMRWSSVPVPLTPSYPGLLRWTSVPGANSYAVWLVDTGKIFTSLSNEADEREYYAFHQDPSWSGTVHWRVRAQRVLYGKTDNGLPAVSYGPWSPIYTNVNPAFATGPLTTQATVTSVVSDAQQARAHEIMPAFVYSGDTSSSGTAAELYRVYVFTDEDCLNVVFRGAIVASPAYVPRPTGPLGLPTDVAGVTAARSAYLRDGSEPTSYTYDGLAITSTESDVSSGTGGGEAATGGQTGSGSSDPLAQIVTGAKVDLWDSDWPGGRYYWTVMPVTVVPSQQVSTTLAASAAAGATTITVANATGIAVGDTLRVGSPFTENTVAQAISGNDITLAAGLTAFHTSGEPVVRPGGGVTYHDAELTQDACASGRVLTFGKSSEPVVTGQTTPFVSGLSPDGMLVAASSSTPRFYGAPLVAWQPAVGADQYEVQWGHSRYPWQTVGTQTTYATSMSLPLKPGTWYYRVRGLDYSIAGSKPQMSWSSPVRLVVTKPRFRIVH